jgi:hypothetical protein
MKSAIPRVVVFTMTLFAAPHMAFAQEPPVHSFELLQVQVGQRLIVAPEDGRSVDGRLISKTGNELAIERRRWNFKKERRVFTEQSVRRISLKDSTLNGTLIGAGVGLAGAVIVYNTCDDDLGCIAPFMMAILLGPPIGRTIDGFNNRELYTSDPGSRVTVSPMVAPNRLGVLAQIRFHRD